ncbi:MAG TPA: carboxymuconolactone decarboxylase family protein [Burkholderiales bacterium]|nr:carboxymuconolactone decarboxylase family protein [Burkholderiales bacterium]
MQPRIPLPNDDQLPADIRETLKTLPPLNVFRMMAAAPASFHGFLQLAGSILMQSEVDARKREIAILRVAHVTRSPYEWTQHVRLARQIGVTQQEIDRIGVDGPVQGLDEEASLLCRVAEEISRDIRLSDEALEAILKRYGVRQATELILCCSYFNMLSRFLESTRVELESTPAF